MTTVQNRRRQFALVAACFSCAVSLCLVAAACGSQTSIDLRSFIPRAHHGHTSDPRLRKVDEMLSANIREGMTRAQVLGFLKTRGYQFEARPDAASLRVVVRHVDSETLQPMIARATFHFDSKDKLTTYELQPAPDVPFQP
jgi:hypothetical protein